MNLEILFDLNFRLAKSLGAESEIIIDRQIERAKEQTGGFSPKATIV